MSSPSTLFGFNLNPLRAAADAAPGVWLLLGGLTAALIYLATIGFVYIFAPIPREPYTSETAYQTVSADGKIISKPLPCWHDPWVVEHARRPYGANEVEKAEVFVSMVVPAYNEEDRLVGMLEEAVDFLESNYPSSDTPSDDRLRNRKPAQNGTSSALIPADEASTKAPPKAKGWEILIVSDGSTDATVRVALDFAQKLKYCDGSIRVVTLSRNRGKGGAVTHGLRHVRGEYVGFADADGASKFADIQKLITACSSAEDAQGRALAVGSRAHLVGSESVVKRSKLRNFLMHSFHLLLRLLTPPATSRIGDTQCGFKLFSRAALPFIVPHMHSEGWIFDVEMLMLAERAGIPMVEVPVGWHEVKGSKLNVVWDSLGMAWGLAILRLAWAMGVYAT